MKVRLGILSGIVVIGAVAITAMFLGYAEAVVVACVVGIATTMRDLVKKE